MQCCINFRIEFYGLSRVKERNAYRRLTIFFIIVNLALLSGFSFSYWGFHAHREINRLAVFTMPPDVIRFYKKHIDYLEENAVNPDERRYAVEDEAPRHFIDLDVYGDSAATQMPRYWHEAVQKYGEDSLVANGIVPWHVYRMKNYLTKAFQEHDIISILRLSADIGHYIADANVPLHTTENYNGQLTDQHGIHGFWESRLPELYSEGYDGFVGKAEYVNNVQSYIWEAVVQAHIAVDSVLVIEKELSAKFQDESRYSYEERGKSTVKVFSRRYSQAYHHKLNGMVERQFRKSVKMVGDIWYSAWVDAGQPDIDLLMNLNLSEAEKERQKEIKKSWKNRIVESREHN